MNIHLKRILVLLGVNRAIGYGVLGRIWTVSSGLITVLLIVTRFSREQQGFYYTIGSLLALQIFFELGLTVVVSQFASHEFSKAEWDKAGAITGDTKSVWRIQSLLSISFKWFAVASLVLIFMLVPAGLFFFSRSSSLEQAFAWRIPWILAVLGTALNLLAVPFFAVIMGSGDMVSVNSRQLIGSMLGSTLAWLVIILDGGLYAISCVSFGSCIVSWGYLLKNKSRMVSTAWRHTFFSEFKIPPENSINWWREVWPMQWRIALSWVSGYFVFQLFNPVLFHYHGAVVAGQMGMTLSAVNALLGVCLTWMNVRSPEFGKFIAKKAWELLDRAFAQVFRQSMLIVIAGALLGGGTIWLFQQYSSIGDRFLPISQVSLLLAATIVTVILNGYATYLRAHKKEPLLLLSIAGAILQGGATWYFGAKYSSFGVTLSFFLISVFFSLPGIYAIWRHYKAEWHRA